MIESKYTLYDAMFGNCGEIPLVGKSRGDLLDKDELRNVLTRSQLFLIRKGTILAMSPNVSGKLTESL